MRPTSSDGGKGDDNRTSNWRAYRDSPLWDNDHGEEDEENAKEEAPTHDEHDNH